MDADRRNDTGIFRYADVEYTPEGHTDAYRWDDFLGIAGGHVYSAMDTIDMVSTGGQYEGDEPEHAYACEIVGCCGLSDGVALFRPVSHDGADLIQIAFLRNEVDDATGAYTERFEAGSFDLPAADLPRSEFGVDLLEYFSGRSFKYTPGVSRGLDPVGLAVLATLPLDAFLDASLSMICRGEGENVGTFTVKPGTYEPIFGIYDPVGGCGGTMGTVLDRDFEIDPHDISYTMMEPVSGEWKSDRIDLYTPQDCFGFSDPFGGRIEYSEKKPKAVVAVKPDPVELGHRASVAASSTVGDRARGAGIRQ